MRRIYKLIVQSLREISTFSQRQIKVLLFHLTAFSFSSGSMGKGDGPGKMSAKDLYGKSTFHT